MKRNIIISLILIGLLAFGIGFGTYAWFTAQAKSEGNQIITGTLTLNNGTDVNLGTLIDVQNQQPGVESDEKTLRLENTGSLPMYLRGKLTGSADKAVDMNKMFLRVTFVSFTRNGQEIPIITEPQDIPFSAFSEVLNTWLPSDEGDGPFMPGDVFTLKFKTYLDNTAGNDWQGVTMTGSLYIEGRQETGEFPTE